MAIHCSDPNPPLKTKSKKIPMPDGVGTFQHAIRTVLVPVLRLVPLTDKLPASVVVGAGRVRYGTVGQASKTLVDVRHLQVTVQMEEPNITRHTVVDCIAVLEVNTTKKKRLVFHVLQSSLAASQCLVPRGAGAPMDIVAAGNDGDDGVDVAMIIGEVRGEDDEGDVGT